MILFNYKRGISFFCIIVIPLLFSFLFFIPLVSAASIIDPITTYFPLIYFFILFVFAFMVVAYWLKNDFFKIMSAFMLMILGVSILQSGVNGIKDWVTYSFGFIFTGIGAYVALLNFEWFENMTGGW